jgi:hypothetical protein
MRASTSFACVIRLSLRQLLGGPIARHIGILKLRDSRVPRDAEAQPFVRCVHQNHPCHLVRISRGKVPHSRTTVRVPHEHERAWLTEFGEDLPQFRDSTVKMFLAWGRGRSLHIRPDLARARVAPFMARSFPSSSRSVSMAAPGHPLFSVALSAFAAPAGELPGRASSALPSAQQSHG